MSWAFFKLFYHLSSSSSESPITSLRPESACFFAIACLKLRLPARSALGFEEREKRETIKQAGSCPSRSH